MKPNVMSDQRDRALALADSILHLKEIGVVGSREYAADLIEAAFKEWATMAVRKYVDETIGHDDDYDDDFEGLLHELRQS